MRAESGTPAISGPSVAQPGFDVSTPNVARVYDVLLGGFFL